MRILTKWPTSAEVPLVASEHYCCCLAKVSVFGWHRVEGILDLWMCSSLMGSGCSGTLVENDECYLDRAWHPCLHFEQLPIVLNWACRACSIASKASCFLVDFVLHLYLYDKDIKARVSCHYHCISCYVTGNIIKGSTSLKGVWRFTTRICYKEGQQSFLYNISSPVKMYQHIFIEVLS